MGLYRIPLQSFLVVAFWAIVSILLRPVGGTVYKVGDSHGWQYNGTAFNYQDWASSINLKLSDVLDFGNANPNYAVVLVPNPQDEENSMENCDIGLAIGTPITLDPKTNLVYLFEFTGNFEFINSNVTYCANYGMRFNVTVGGQPGSNTEPPLPGNPGSPDGGPSTTPMATTNRTKNNPVGWIVGVVTGVVVVLGLIVLLFVMKKRVYWERFVKLRDPTGVILSNVSDSRTPRHSSSTEDFESGDIEFPWGPRRFSYSDLKGATDSFNSSLVVGEGGFGTVYRGYLKDSPGAAVAVKRLSQYARQGAREFMAELNIISQLRHRNLVQLVGWCDEDEELILVYEFMPNGDLDDLIFGGFHGDDVVGCNPLPWKCRYHAFVGVATALVYLHEDWEQRVVHRDVKTANVMLDSHFNARLGDFGLARLSAHSQAPRTTLVAGTIGYLAPEFTLTGRATDKTDVYAFGVVVLEVSCARRPLTTNCILVDWVWDLHKEEKLLDAIDPKLEVTSIDEEEEVKLALQVGLLCCHPDPGARPTMRHVLNILTGETPLPKMPRSRPVAVFTEER